MSKIFKESMLDFGYELLDDIRGKTNERISDAEFGERIVGIEKATISMIEADVNDDTIIAMLQKHWDLRLSEAEVFIDKARDGKI